MQRRTKYILEETQHQCGTILNVVIISQQITTSQGYCHMTNNSPQTVLFTELRSHISLAK